MASRQQATPRGGSMPTGGANRPGPFRYYRQERTEKAAAPVAIALDRLGIKAAVQPGDFVGGIPAEPPTPAVVLWNRASSPLGVPGVVLIAGKTTVSADGPSAFTRLSEAAPGDTVVLTGDNGGAYRFRLDSVDGAAAPPDLTSLLAQRQNEQLALLGWDGDYPAAGTSQPVVLAIGSRES